MAEPLTPEEQKKRYEEFLARFNKDGLSLQPVSVPVDDERLRVRWDGQPQLSESEAQTIIFQRLGADLGPGDRLHSSAQHFNELARYVLYSMPEEAWTTNLLENIDMRPYLQNVVTYYDNGGTMFENKQLGIMQNREIAELAKSRLDEENRVADEEVKKSQGTNSATPPPVDPTTAGLSVAAQVTGWTSDVQMAAQEGRTGNSFQEWASGGDALEMPTVSEQEIRDALAMSGSTDILDIMTVSANYAEQGRSVPQQMVQVGDPLAPSSPLDPGGGRFPGRLSYTAAAKYLQGPNVTPKTIENMQNSLIRAGYLDGMNARITTGDGWDQATNIAWRRALDDAYMRDIPLPQLLMEQAEQRTASFRPLSGLAQQSMLDQVAQSVLGRTLDRQEQAQLIQQLYTLRDKPLQGANADGSGGNMGEGMWFSEADVTEKLLSEHGGELGGMAAADSMYAINKMMQGMFK